LQGGAITPATDIYALGIVIYEMLTGSTPHTAGTAMAMALKRLSEPAPSPRDSVPGLDAKWEATVAHCLERDPKDRFNSTDEVIRTLRGEIAPPARRMSAGMRKIAVSVPAVIALLVLVGGAWFAKNRWFKPVDQGQAGVGQTTTKTRPTVAILGFQNLSQTPNSALLGGMLTDGLWAQLDVDELRFVPPNQVDEMKRNLGIKEIKASIDAKELARIQEYLGTQVLVTGSYRVSGEGPAGKVEWNIHLLGGKNGEGLGSIPDSGSENDLHGMIARAGKRIRTKLGVELTATEEGRLDSSFSANADALRNFSAAREKLRTFDLLGAIRSLEKSVDADPSFIQAHAALAEAWSELGYDGKAEEEAKKAFDLSAKLPAEARGLVVGRYYEMTYDWTKAMQNYASLRTLFPDDPEYGLLLARSQTNGGKGQAALMTLEQTEKQRLPAAMGPQLQLAKSEAQESLGNYHEQLSAASAAAEQAKALQGKLLLARARIQECKALLNLGDPQRARPLCEEARTLNVEAGDQLATAKATNVVANAAYQQGQLADAKNLYEQALNITENIGDKFDEAGALNNLATVLDDQGDSASAIRTYKKSVEVAKERGNKSGMALAEQNLAMVMFRSGDAVGGRKMFLSAIQISREIGDKPTEAAALNNLCIFSLSAGEAKAAAQNCEDSLRLRTEIDSKPNMARSMVSRGDIRLAAGNMAGAKEDYEGALKIQETLGIKSDAAYSRVALAWLALRGKRFADAGQYAAEAMKEFVAEKDNDGEAEARAAEAEAKAGLKDLAGAQAEVETAGSLVSKSSDPELELKIELSKARIETESGKFAEAIARLQNLQKNAQKSGLVALAMEAKLAMGIVQIKSSKVAEGKLLLAQVQKDAQAKGFGRIAQEAADAR
jgi:tetratricopeptide (TPR) repeat protein